MCYMVPTMVRSPKQRRGGAILRPRPVAHRHRRRPPAAPQKPFDDTILHLRHIQSTVIVAVAALRRQNCELDEDIASLLQRCVCDRIDDQLEKLESDRSLTVGRQRRI